MVFTDLATAARERPELVQRHLGRRQTIDSHAHFWARAHAGVDAAARSCTCRAA